MEILIRCAQHHAPTGAGLRRAIDNRPYGEAGKPLVRQTDMAGGEHRPPISSFNAKSVNCQFPLTGRMAFIREAASSRAWRLWAMAICNAVILPMASSVAAVSSWLAAFT